MGLKLTNNSISRLAANVAAGDTSISITPGDGAKFPSLGAGDYFPATLVRGSDGAFEIVTVTARSTDTLTVTRAQESTTAKAFVAGDRIELRLTAKTFTDQAPEIVTHAASSKTTPVDADEIPLVDSEATFGLKKITWANIKAGVFSAWGALINGGTAKTTPVDADAFAMMDSAASNATKKTTFANIKAAMKSYFDTLYYSVSNQAALRNRIINGAFLIDQRNAGSAQTIVAGAALAYTVDRFWAYCTGANVTGQRVSGTAPNKYNYRFTGAASVTSISFGQRIESSNSQDLAGQTATLSVDLSNSLLTTVNWVAYYANSDNSFGTIASPTKTQIATGSFTVNGTLTRYNAQINIPSAATTGIEILFNVGAQTSGEWTIGRVQLEAGSVATQFEQQSIDKILSSCQRYYSVCGYGWTGTPNTTGFVLLGGTFPVQMRAGAAVSGVGGSIGASSIADSAGTKDINAYTSFGSGGNAGGWLYAQNTGATLLTGQTAVLIKNLIVASAEL